MIMDLEKQVCSLELAKRLKELGVETEAYHYWCYHNSGVWDLERWNSGHANWYAAYSVAELGELLPNLCEVWHGENDGSESLWFASAGETIESSYCIAAATEANAKAKLLVWYLEQDKDTGSENAGGEFARRLRAVVRSGVSADLEIRRLFRTLRRGGGVRYKESIDHIIDSCVNHSDCREDSDTEEGDAADEFFGPLGSVVIRDDAVNHPDHYTSGGLEVIDVIEKKGLGYHLGNAVKYILRAGVKDPDKWKEDLRKAIWYIERFIQFGSEVEACDEARVERDN